MSAPSPLPWICTSDASRRSWPRPPISESTIWREYRSIWESLSIPEGRFNQEPVFSIAPVGRDPGFDPTSDSTRLSLLLLLFLTVTHDLGLDRADCRADEGRPILGGPVARARGAADAILEAGHDVAGHELVALERRVAVRPLVSHVQQAAESSRLALQAFD